MVTLHFYSWVQTDMVLGQVQQPITDLSRPLDIFMVHGVNNPLIYLKPTAKEPKNL